MEVNNEWKMRLQRSLGVCAFVCNLFSLKKHAQSRFVTFQKIENCFAYLNKSLIYNFI